MLQSGCSLMGMIYMPHLPPFVVAEVGPKQGQDRVNGTHLLYVSAPSGLHLQPLLHHATAHNPHHPVLRRPELNTRSMPQPRAGTAGRAVYIGAIRQSDSPSLISWQHTDQLQLLACGTTLEHCAAAASCLCARTRALGRGRDATHCMS